MSEKVSQDFRKASNSSYIWGIKLKYTSYTNMPLKGQKTFGVPDLVIESFSKADREYKKQFFAPQGGG